MKNRIYTVVNNRRKSNMKKYPTIKVFAVLTMFALYGCGQQTPEGTEKAKPNYKPLSDSSEAVKKQEAANPNRPPAKPAAAKESEAKTTDDSSKNKSSASSVVDYATGKTQLSIKQSVEKKINNIQGTHNQDVKKALDDN